MRFIVCAYRDWGLKTGAAIADLFPHHEFVTASSQESLRNVIITNGMPDAVLAIGWSWIFDRGLVESCWVVGVHPSDLPHFAGGSPIQHQILAGITHTKNSLFRITPKLDGGAILGKVPLNLGGHMNEIFDRLVHSSILLIADFIRAFPENLQPIEQSSDVKYAPFRRLSPESGRLTREDLTNKQLRALHDFIRCREEPYPNAYVEDETGVLLFKQTEFRVKS